MNLEYTVSKEKGSKRWYTHKTGEPGKPVAGSYGTKRNALHIAANYSGLAYKDYMSARRKGGE